MTALLRLPRGDGFALNVPEGEGLCETCREPAPATLAGARYCSPLCALFDRALADLAAAYHAADDDRDAPAVRAARRRLRTVARLYDAVHGIG